MNKNIYIQPVSNAICIHLEKPILSASDINGKPPAWIEGESGWFSDEPDNSGSDNSNYWQ